MADQPVTPLFFWPRKKMPYQPLKNTGRLWEPVTLNCSRAQLLKFNRFSTEVWTRGTQNRKKRPFLQSLRNSLHKVSFRTFHRASSPAARGATVFGCVTFQVAPKSQTFWHSSANFRNSSSSKVFIWCIQHRENLLVKHSYKWTPKNLHSWQLSTEIRDQLCLHRRRESLTLYSAPERTWISFWPTVSRQLPYRRRHRYLSFRDLFFHKRHQHSYQRLCHHCSRPHCQLPTCHSIFRRPLSSQQWCLLLLRRRPRDLPTFPRLFIGNSREYPNPDFTGWETHGGRINFLHDAIGSRACNSYPRQADHGAVSYRAFPSLIFGKVRNANVYYCERGKVNQHTMCSDVPGSK